MMSSAEKEKLFRQLLCMFGIGAKTNVGFGIMGEDETNGAVKPKRSAPRTPAQIRSIPAREQRKPAPGQGDFRPGLPKRPVDRIKCPYCGTMNFKFKPNSTAGPIAATGIAERSYYE